MGIFHQNSYRRTTKIHHLVTSHIDHSVKQQHSRQLHIPTATSPYQKSRCIPQDTWGALFHMQATATFRHFVFRLHVLASARAPTADKPTWRLGARCCRRRGRTSVTALYEAKILEWHVRDRTFSFRALRERGKVAVTGKSRKRPTTCARMNVWICLGAAAGRMGKRIAPAENSAEFKSTSGSRCILMTARKNGRHRFFPMPAYGLRVWIYIVGFAKCLLSTVWVVLSSDNIMTLPV